MRAVVPLSLLLWLSAVGCAYTDVDSSDIPEEETVTQALTWQAEHVGPRTGFVSAVQFAPGSSTKLWISGDDASGFYTSNDGGTSLAPLTSSPLDWSTYAFAFAGARVVAPSYFGRGVAISDNSGATWRVLSQGLPQGADDARRIYDVVITAAGHILVGTGSGLYRSIDAVSFTKVTAGLATALAITRILRTPTGLLAGSGNGRIYMSSDGASWLELSDSDGPTVSDLAIGVQGTYVATNGGLVVRFTPTGALEVVANPVTDARLATSLWTKLAVVPRGAVDRIYLGVVGFAHNRSAAKLFVSDNGGATFAARGAGLSGASIFSIAVDPANASHAVIGTVSEGVFQTRDAGVSWTRTTGDLRAAAVIGFARDPADPEHWLLTSYENLPGTPSLYERRAATGWTIQRSLLEDSPALAFFGGEIIAAPGTPGLPMRAATSAAGPWRNEPSTAGFVQRLVTTRRGLYAAGANVERREGTTWRVLYPSVMNDIAEQPAAYGSALVACGLGMVVSSNGAFTDAALLPAPGRAWFTCRFDSAGRLLATGDGELWMAQSLTAARVATGWKRVVTPLDGVQVLSAQPNGTRWWLGGGSVDVGASIGAKSGLYYSENGGGTWVAAHNGMWPSRTVWQLQPGRDEREMFVALWGGGLWRLVGQ